MLFFSLYTQALYCQEKTGISVVFGAENEEIPSKYDTIKSFYKDLKSLKSIKYQDGKYLYLVEYNEKGKKEVSTKQFKR